MRCNPERTMSLSNIDRELLGAVVGGDTPYSKNIDGWWCDVGRDGGITSCTNSAPGVNPLSERLRKARYGPNPTWPYVPGVVDPEGKYGPPTKRGG
jgi:hypothetical protein